MNWSTSAPAPALGGLPDFLGDFGITDAGADRAADARDTKAAPVAEKPWKVRTGSYLDGGYVYFYNAGADELYIVLNPKGSTARVPVASGSAAYKAILAAIRNQKATQISAARVKELRTAAGGGRKAPRPSKAAHVHEEVAEVAPPAPLPKTSFLDSLPGWAPYAAGGVVLSVIASVVLFASPSARPAPAR